ncbi:MAG: carboxypeptidase-like regulatory domain-containing protein [Bacteroidales bacterium]|nr:carboxypeptidase-like regulatory domain-containing protein [Bacteroidales bacterium]
MKGIKTWITVLSLAVSFSAFAQNITVKGTVTDAQTGDPIPSAAVVVSGTANGVVSDFDGHYTITVASDGVLIFSSIGYETMQVPVQGKKTLNVELSQSAEFLDETIVVAYGTAKKSSYSGSATMVRSEALAQTGGDAKGVLNALQAARGASATDGSLQSIYYERRKELYGEGFRLPDIKRLHQPLVRSADPEHWATVKDLPADSPRFMLPIPEVEMLYNKALTSADQNDFWKK